MVCPYLHSPPLNPILSVGVCIEQDGAPYGRLSGGPKKCGSGPTAKAPGAAITDPSTTGPGLVGTGPQPKIGCGMQLAIHTLKPPDNATDRLPAKALNRSDPPCGIASVMIRFRNVSFKMMPSLDEIMLISGKGTFGVGGASSMGTALKAG